MLPTLPSGGRAATSWFTNGAAVLRSLLLVIELWQPVKLFDKVRQALIGGFASSRVLEIHGERMINRAFDPGFRVELHHKDLNIALSNAHALGINLPNTTATLELLNTCIAQGDAKLDSSVMIRSLEKLADLNIQET